MISVDLAALTSSDEDATHVITRVTAVPGVPAEFKGVTVSVCVPATAEVSTTFVNASRGLALSMKKVPDVGVPDTVDVSEDVAEDVADTTDPTPEETTVARVDVVELSVLTETVTWPPTMAVDVAVS